LSLEQVKGIGNVGATKLVANGINNADELSVQRPEEVQSILGISLKASKDIINSAKELMSLSSDIFNANDYEEKIDKTARFIHSGSASLDAILGGGWKTRTSHGIFGEFSTGKSQFCNSAVAFAIDAGYDVCYVETEPNTFNKGRLEQISKSRELKFDGTKVHVVPATQIGTVYAQMRAYEMLWGTAEKNGWDVALMVVDSFNAKFRRAFSGREMYPDRAAEFGRHLDYLEEFAKHFNSATLLPFQVGITPEAGGQQGDQMRYNIENYPVGGTLVQHNVNTWISLKQVKGGTKSTNVYEANLVDSSYLPKATCQFMINEQGVVDF
jgi:meiotic recombination protein DMC1